MNILDGATRMTVSKELCDSCSASKLSATFKEVSVRVGSEMFNPDVCLNKCWWFIRNVIIARLDFFYVCSFCDQNIFLLFFFVILNDNVGICIVICQLLFVNLCTIRSHRYHLHNLFYFYIIVFYSQNSSLYEINDRDINVENMGHDTIAIIRKNSLDSMHTFFFVYHSCLYY